ncbi:MAG: hypothetical protein JST89_03195 [Cyanobacteria bacterium SZAS-4]|nr:hypothetical protein [Cyanobacteria bacterium SZAS-4]
MPESNAAPTEKTDDRPVMHKRVEHKEDGRTLIYYTFEKSVNEQKKSESEAAK